MAHTLEVGDIVYWKDPSKTAEIVDFINSEIAVVEKPIDLGYTSLAWNITELTLKGSKDIHMRRADLAKQIIRENSWLEKLSSNEQEDVTAHVLSGKYDEILVNI